MKKTFITCLVGFGIIMAGAVQTQANKAGTPTTKSDHLRHVTRR